MRHHLIFAAMALAACSTLPAPPIPPPTGSLTAVEIDEFDRAVAVATDGDRLFVVEQRGVIWTVDPSGMRSMFLDLTSVVDFDGNERGLVGLAFADRGRFYVSYTDAAALRVVEYPAERVVLSVPRLSDFHHGGWIGIGPDGQLWTRARKPSVPIHGDARLDFVAVGARRCNRQCSARRDQLRR